MCHVNTSGARAITAPNLFGLSGRAAGSTPFKGSTALAKSGVTWNANSLDQFLQAPAKMIPGTRMVVKVPDANQRHDLIAYLLSLH
ncbi:cytochrome C [Novosphingobium sp. 1949]|uniref:Cytochrome C n=1 Tax=Novosphingobium organovorum TaxID=2930092 RepID=A0ABT0BAR9_9SPHN|nr:cytochrome C [Novosphingobium organovorum]